MLFPRVIERHADEAAFLWGRRERAARSPSFDLTSLTLLDQRLDANLEGLVVARERGLEACLDALGRAAGGGPLAGGGELFAGLFVAAELGDTMALARLLLRAGEYPSGKAAVATALGWLSAPAARRVLTELFADESPRELQRLALRGFAARREDPGPGLARALESEDEGVRSRAFRVVGELGLRDLLPALRVEARARAEKVDPWALWSLVRFGEASAVPLLFQVAEGGGPTAEHACALAVTASTALDAAASLSRLLARGEFRVALAGAEARGDPASIPWVLDLMESRPELRRRAAWVYASIAGARLEPPLAVRAPEDDPTDADVARRAADPYEDLPAPQVEAIHEHWHRVRRSVAPGERRLGGRLVEPSSLSELLWHGAQPSRARAAIELARTSASGDVFPVTAAGFTQSARLASSLRSVRSVTGSQGEGRST